MEVGEVAPSLLVVASTEGDPAHMFGGRLERKPSEGLRVSLAIHPGTSLSRNDVLVSLHKRLLGGELLLSLGGLVDFVCENELASGDKRSEGLSEGTSHLRASICINLLWNKIVILYILVLDVGSLLPNFCLAEERRQELVLLSTQVWVALFDHIFKTLLFISNPTCTKNSKTVEDTYFAVVGAFF